MTDQEFYDDEFIVMLTIDGTSYDEIEVKVTDPNKTIRDQINSIVQVFELPKMDNGGNPIQYLLGKLMDGDEELLKSANMDFIALNYFLFSKRNYYNIPLSACQ